MNQHIYILNNESESDKEKITMNMAQRSTEPSFVMVASGVKRKSKGKKDVL